MNAFRAGLVPFAALALSFVFQHLAHARPVVIEDVATLSPPPDPTWEFFGRFGVAIDGDWALVSGERYVADRFSAVRRAARCRRFSI